MGPTGHPLPLFIHPSQYASARISTERAGAVLVQQLLHQLADGAAAAPEKTCSASASVYLATTSPPPLHQQGRVPPQPVGPTHYRRQWDA
nr:unnamed protein product [Digitaria exilis]